MACRQIICSRHRQKAFAYSASVDLTGSIYFDKVLFPYHIKQYFTVKKQKTVLKNQAVFFCRWSRYLESCHAGLQQKADQGQQLWEDGMYVAMNVRGLTVDPITSSPIVILKEINGDKTLPIWIGLLEATAIASELEDIKFSRPMTHDLIKNIIELLDVKIVRIEVNDLKDNTYFARINFEYKGKDLSVDARPSDAMALALRVDLPVFVASKVIEKSTEIDLKAEAADKSEEGKKWQEILESFSPDDFGKYKM